MTPRAGILALALCVAGVMAASPAAPAAPPDPVASDVAGDGAPRAIAPPDSTLERWSSLGLRRLRVALPAGRAVLVRPSFAADGIGWRAVEGFPRARPALIAGADWDSVKPPPNPVPWSQVAALEVPRAGPRRGAVIGGGIGFVLVGLPALGVGLWAASVVREGDMQGVVLAAGGIAFAATMIGAVLGHVAIPPATRWDPLAQPASAPGSAAIAPADSTAPPRDR